MHFETQLRFLSEKKKWELGGLLLFVREGEEKKGKGSATPTRFCIEGEKIGFFITSLLGKKREGEEEGEKKRNKGWKRRENSLSLAEWGEKKKRTKQRCF